MDTINNVLNNFNSIVDYMSKCINNKFIKVQKACRNLDPNGRYYLHILNKDSKVVFGSELQYDGNKWYVDFKYEDTCCSNSLPCKNYKDSIIGMTTAEVAEFFSEFSTALIADTTDDWKKISTIKL